MIPTTTFQLYKASRIEYLNLVTNELKFESSGNIKFNSIEYVEMEKGGFAIINSEQSTYRKIVNYVNNLFLSNDNQVELLHSENKEIRLFTIIVNNDNYQKILKERERARLQVGLEDSKKIQAKLAEIEPEFNKLQEKIKASFVTEDLKSRFDLLEREFYIAVTKSKNMEHYRTTDVIIAVASFSCRIAEIARQVTELEN